MIKAFKAVFSIFLLGVFLIPGMHAAGTTDEGMVAEQTHACCDEPSEQDSDHREDSKSCCDQPGDSSGDCSGTCGAVSCQHVSQTAFVLQVLHNSLFTLEHHLAYPPYKQLDHSKNFHTIWQPPKIS